MARSLFGKFLLPVWALLMILSGCAGGQAKPVALQPNEHHISMEAGDFYFNPNTIDAAPGVLTISVHNASGKTHNLTIENPQGNTLVSRDIAPGATENVTANFDQPGTYKFHCDKDMHSALGMKGKIVVAKT